MKKIVKKSGLFVLLATIFIMNSGFRNYENTCGSYIQEQIKNTPITNKVFQAGEVLTYQIYYNWNMAWMLAGEVTFAVKDAGENYHVLVLGRTDPSYEWFYKVNDRYESLINKKTLLPVKHIREVHEGGYHLFDEILFDQNGKKASSRRGDSDVKATNKKQFSLSGYMHDLVSILYYARNVDYDAMQANQLFPVEIFMDEKEYKLQVRYRGREAGKRIKDLNGKYNVINISPEVIKGSVFKESDRMECWASDDKNRIPLYITSPISVGSVKAIIKSYKGIKYPMEAKLK